MAAGSVALSIGLALSLLSYPDALALVGIVVWGFFLWLGTEWLGEIDISESTTFLNIGIFIAVPLSLAFDLMRVHGFDEPAFLFQHSRATFLFFLAGVPALQISLAFWRFRKLN